MTHLLRPLIALATLLMCGFAVAQPANSLPQPVLLTYLDQLTQWQRDAAAIEPSATNAREVVFRDSLRDNAAKVLQSGFSFLRGVAEDAPVESADPESTGARLTRQAENMRHEIAVLQARGATEEVRIARARLELLETILANLNANSSKSPNKLRYTIESITRSIPELSGEQAKPVKKTEAAATRHTAPSILSVSATIFEVTRKQRELAGVIARTTDLKNQSMEIMKTLRAGLGETVPDEEQAAAEEKEAQPAIPMSADARVAAYKRIGEHIVPLAETMRWIDASRQTLKEWSGVLEQYRQQLLRQLSIYVGILVLAFIAVALLSELSRRALKKVRDAKRKRKLNTIRRVLTAMAFVFVLLFNFISDFGSFATFAGFMTAGLAVALQSVLLSLVAHFLFYGRYGVRNGDRVNVAGVTGDIVQIGWVRFYLRELKENTKGELVPTGKTVAFPNGILFQNVAFYKYA